MDGEKDLNNLMFSNSLLFSLVRGKPTGFLPARGDALVGIEKRVR
jgi:hypothetical protein